MADDNKILVQIVLDDGSIVKGFATLEKKAEEAAGKASKSLNDVDTEFSLDSAISKLKGLVPIASSVAIGITSVLAGVALAFERAFEGEKIKAAEDQFHILASTAKLSGDEIANGLEVASRGTFDLSDNINVVNQAIIELGGNAGKLPQIMGVATKAALVTGQTTEQSFSTIINAIESGNVKTLRQSGIFIDAEKVLKDYARTLGLTSSELNATQRQQAILNATLETAAVKFKDVDVSARPIQGALDRIKVAFHEINDSIAKTSNSSFGNFFALNLERLAAAMGNTQSRAIYLESAIKDLQDRLANKANIDQTTIPVLEESLKRARQELDLINAQKSAAEDDARKAARFSKEPNNADTAALASINASKQLDAQQIEAKRSRELQIQQIVLDSNQKQLDAENARATNIINLSDRQKALDQITNQQKLLDEDAHQLAIKQINDRYSDDKAFSQAQRNATLLAEDESFKAKQIQNEQKVLAQKRAIEAQKVAAFQTALGQIATLQDSGSRELFEVGKLAAISNATISGILAVQNALACGLPPPLNFAVAAAVGIAAALNVQKIASTSFGDKSVPGAPAFSGGGGGINSGLETPAGSPALATAQPGPAKPQTTIEVNVAGNVFDSHETGLRIVDIINNAFDQNGVVVTGGSAA